MMRHHSSRHMMMRGHHHMRGMGSMVALAARWPLIATSKLSARSARAWASIFWDRSPSQLGLKT